MKIKALAHVCLRTKDLNALLRFYRDMLGMKPLFNFTKNGKIAGVYLKIADGMYLEAFEVPDAPDRHDQASPLSHFCLQTDDIRALYQKLIDNGYKPATEIRLGADQSWQFWIQDPAGIRIEFHEYTPESSQLTGRDVAITW